MGNSPVLVNHIRDPEAVINNLTPSVAVEVFGAKLAGTEIPRATVRIRGVLIDLRHLLALLKQLLQTEQVPINTLANTRFSSVLDMRSQRGAEILNHLLARRGRVRVRFAKGDTLIGDGAGGFRAAL